MIQLRFMVVRKTNLFAIGKWESVVVMCIGSYDRCFVEREASLRYDVMSKRRKCIRAQQSVPQRLCELMV